VAAALLAELVGIRNVLSGVYLFMKDAQEGRCRDLPQD
jgi:hypothetical protein